MKLYIYLVVTLLSFLGHAQEPFFKINYNVNLDRLPENLKEYGGSQSTIQLFKMIADAAKSVNLELLISNSTSYFNESKSLSSANDIENKLKTLVSVSSFRGGWFYDVLKKDLIFIREYENKKFYVRKNNQLINWKITSEKKTILGYNCIKATYIIKVPHRGDVKITAWFTKEIPLPFGPANYVGQLPGLILELEEVNATYTATKVEQLKRFVIKPPDEKDIITEDAYKKEGNKVMDFYKKMN